MDFSMTSQGYMVTFPNGKKYAYDAPVEFEGMLGGRSDTETSMKTVSDTADLSEADKNGECKVLAVNTLEVNAGLPSSWDTIYDRIIEDLNYSGREYHTEDLKSFDKIVEVMESLADYDVILWKSHGDYDKENTYFKFEYLPLRDYFEFCKTHPEYDVTSEECYQGVYLHFNEKNKEKINLWFSDEYIDCFYENKPLREPIAFLLPCWLAQNDIMPNAFLRNGARVVLAYQYRNFDSFNKMHMEFFQNQATVTDENHEVKWTIKEIYDRAVEETGKTYATIDAYIAIMGGREFDFSKFEKSFDDMKLYGKTNKMQIGKTPIDVEPTVFCFYGDETAKLKASEDDYISLESISDKANALAGEGSGEVSETKNIDYENTSWPEYELSIRGNDEPDSDSFLLGGFGLRKRKADSTPDDSVNAVYKEAPDFAVNIVNKQYNAGRIRAAFADHTTIEENVWELSTDEMNKRAMQELDTVQQVIGTGFYLRTDEGEKYFTVDYDALYKAICQKDSEDNIRLAEPYELFRREGEDTNHFSITLYGNISDSGMASGAEVDILPDVVERRGFSIQSRHQKDETGEYADIIMNISEVPGANFVISIKEGQEVYSRDYDYLKPSEDATLFESDAFYFSQYIVNQLPHTLTEEELLDDDDMSRYIGDSLSWSFGGKTYDIRITESHLGWDYMIGDGGDSAVDSYFSIRGWAYEATP